MIFDKGRSVSHNVRGICHTIRGFLSLDSLMLEEVLESLYFKILYFAALLPFLFVGTLKIAILWYWRAVLCYVALRG